MRLLVATTNKNKVREIRNDVMHFDPDGIDDGYFLVFVNRKQLWGNMPANYHNGACGFSFADGHAEIRKWKDPDTLSKKIVANPRGTNDVPWTQLRTSAPKDESTTWPP